MLLKFNRDTELEVVGLGIFKPDEFVVTDDETRAKKYLDSGYFDEVKERKKKIKVKKSKMKGVDK
ncbi:hypothetical protein ES705_46386 [subsurface metagenome]